MVYFKNKKWYIVNEKVNYIDSNEELTNIVGQEGKKWWLDLADKYDDITIVDFTEIDITDEQLKRLKEVNQLNINQGHSGVLADYVIRNKFPIETNHPLKDLQNKKNREEQEPYIMDLDFRVSMMELGM